MYTVASHNGAASMPAEHNDREAQEAQIIIYVVRWDITPAANGFWLSVAGDTIDPECGVDKSLPPPMR